jgi:hypothetical protein
VSGRFRKQAVDGEKTFVAADSLCMGVKLFIRLRRGAMLAGMFLFAHASAISADQSALLGISVTVVRSCQFDSGGDSPYTGSAGVPAVRCGGKTPGRVTSTASMQPNVEPDYQLSSGKNQLTLTVAF